jgi:regulatory protein
VDDDPECAPDRPPPARPVRVVRFDAVPAADRGPNGDPAEPRVARIDAVEGAEQAPAKVAAFDALSASSPAPAQVVAFADLVAKRAARWRGRRDADTGNGPRRDADAAGGAGAPSKGRPTRGRRGTRVDPGAAGEGGSFRAPGGPPDASVPRGRRPGTRRQPDPTSEAGSLGPAGARPDAPLPPDGPLPPDDLLPLGRPLPPDGPLPRGRRRGGRVGRLGPDGPDPELPEPDADPVAVAREICLRLLTDRARTRQELAQALARKGVPLAAAAAVLDRFDEVGLIDDAAFAGQWVRSRHQHRGLGRRAIAVELRRKGVADDVAGEALAEVDAESETRRARELVERKLRSLPVGTPEQRAAAARRLVGMLARKGYGAGTAYGVVREALAERGAEAEELGGIEQIDD